MSAATRHVFTALMLCAVTTGADAQQRSRQPRATAQPPAQGSGSVSVAERGGKDAVSFTREVFSYSGAGRRDPFVSLFASGDLRPLFKDLRLVTVVYDPSGNNSVAILRDAATKDQYRVRVGQTVGRMRVTRIDAKSVAFSINELGYSRQEVLTYSDSTQARKP